ncbi:MAG: hypothetical protein ABI811_00285 [Acidobacteriota bacterium]
MLQSPLLMRVWNSVRLLCGIAVLATFAQAQPQPKPIRRPANNQLALETAEAPVGRIDSPGAISVITNNLVFHVSPLSGKGLLSQQVDDALKALDKANGAATLVKLRAFVAGTGDLRRVQSIVNDLFTARKLPLPAVTTLQTGALTLEGAQVVIESISEEKKSVNPSGLAFFAAKEAASGVAAVAMLDAAMKTAGAVPLRVTCFSDSLTEATAAQNAAAKTFPKAAGSFLQSTRYTLGAMTACEGVGQASPSSTGAIVRSAKVILTAPQLAFSETDADLQLAFDRLNKTLEPFAVTLKEAVFTNLYALTKAMADKALAMAGAGTSQVVEALPSLDGTMAVEAVIPAK